MPLIKLVITQKDSLEKIYIKTMKENDDEKKNETLNM